MNFLLKSFLVLFAVSFARIPSDGTASFDMYDSIMNSFNGVGEEQFQRPTTYSKRYSPRFTDDAMNQWLDM